MLNPVFSIQIDFIFDQEQIHLLRAVPFIDADFDKCIFMDDEYFTEYCIKGEKKERGSILPLQ
jgi:hypothetical protein